MIPAVTKKKTHIAPYVNAERFQCLVVEDDFPNGRPPLERAGVLFCDRKTVSRAERMKVTVCLNPLHTAMGVYGCLLGYARISECMKDSGIAALVRRLGYTEGLPVAEVPDIISPKSFLDEVLRERLPNPYIPDTPERIVADHSQKVPVRFGETIKTYIAQNRDMDCLIALPLAVAGWFRYLLGVDDRGGQMELSADPRKEELTQKLAGVVWNNPASLRGQLTPLLSDATLFGADLTQTVLAGRIHEYFLSLLGGAGAVRETLQSVMRNASA